MEFLKILAQFVAQRFKGREISTWLGVAATLVYGLGVGIGSDENGLKAILEALGWGLPGAGVLGILAPESTIKKSLSGTPQKKDRRR